MDFTYDVSQTSIIGSKVFDLGDDLEKGEAVDKASEITTVTNSSSQSNGDMVVPGWKRPQLSQVVKMCDSDIYILSFLTVLAREV